MRNATTFYYRIQSVDFDGSISFTETVVVTREARVETVSFSVFPNPTSDYLNMDVSGVEEGTTAVTTLYNEIGERTLVQNDLIYAGQSVQLNLLSLHAGTYTVQTIIDGQSYNNKIIVIR